MWHATLTTQQTWLRWAILKTWSGPAVVLLLVLTDRACYRFSSGKELQLLKFGNILNTFNYIISGATIHRYAAILRWADTNLGMKSLYCDILFNIWAHLKHCSELECKDWFIPSEKQIKILKVCFHSSIVSCINYKGQCRPESFLWFYGRMTDAALKLFSLISPTELY